MAKGIIHGLATEDHPMFSMPLYISTVKRLSELAANTQQNPDGETQETASEMNGESEGVQDDQ